MRVRLGVCLLAMGLVAAPASAQLVVIDPGNLAQVVLIAQRTQKLYQQLQAEYQTVLRMSQGLTDLDQYRIPPMTISGLDPARWQFGRPWIQGLESGDPTGADYLASALPLQRPGASLKQLSPEAQQTFERHYASVEIADSVAMLGGHQVALVRNYADRLQTAVQSLQSDVLNQSPSYHELTEDLDKIAVGELLGRREDMASNQLLSHALEQLLAQNKSERDTEASAINMQLVTWRDSQAANDAFVEGTGNALATWRQP